MAILDAVADATAECEGEPENYRTTLTPSDLASIAEIDLNERPASAGQFLQLDAPFAPGDLDGLSGVQTVYCEGCSFGVGNRGNVAGARALQGAPRWFLAQLHLLSLGNRDLERLQEVRFFEGLNNLRELVLERNNMVYELPGNPDRPQNTAIGELIDPEVWRYLPNLRKLAIGSNRILTLPRTFFRHLGKLEELDMFEMWYEYHAYGFGTQALPAGIFEGLSRLKRLDLGSNALGAAAVADGFFDGLNALEFMDLRDNPLLERLPGSVLDLPAGVRVLTDPQALWPEEEPDPDRTTYSVFATRGAIAVAEGTAVSFVVDRTGDVSSTQILHIEVSETGAMLQGSPPETIEVRAGRTEIPLLLATDDDTVDESNSRVTILILEDPAYSVRIAEASETVQDNDATPPSTGGGGGGGEAANRPPVVERRIENQLVSVGEALELDVRLNFYDRDQRALDYTVAIANPAVATVEVGRDAVLTFDGQARGVTRVTVTASDRRNESVSQSFLLRVNGPAILPLFPQAADPVRQGFARIVNHSSDDGEIVLFAYDDRGTRVGPISLSAKANAVLHFNSRDLEEGNAAKGLSGGVGPGQGDWWLVMESDLDFEALSYVRTEDGFLAAMHDVAPWRDGAYRIATFNPGSNLFQESRLRVVNPGKDMVEVRVSAMDDAGASPGSEVLFEVPAGNAQTLTAADLEAGAGVEGKLGHGEGKWRLDLQSSASVLIMSLLASPTGHLTNLSTTARVPGGETDRHLVPLFPAASDPQGRQGFVRVVNRDDEAGEVHIEARDDTETVYDTLTLAIGPREAVHFNSDDLELGNRGKGLTGSTGSGAGNWRLSLSSTRNIEALAYVRTTDGFLTSMHDVVPAADGRHWVAMVNPAANRNQASILRLVNPGSAAAGITITGLHDSGAPSSELMLSIPSGMAREITAQELESGGERIAGALGNGAAKWRLQVVSEQDLLVMSLLSNVTGHITNLSTAPDRGPY